MKLKIQCCTRRDLLEGYLLEYMIYRKFGSENIFEEISRNNGKNTIN